MSDFKYFVVKSTEGKFSIIVNEFTHTRYNYRMNTSTHIGKFYMVKYKNKNSIDSIYDYIECPGYKQMT